MSQTSAMKRKRPATTTKKNGLGKRIWKYKALLLMLLPGIVYLFIFNYIPMYGVLIAFQDFKIKFGVFGSEFVGFENFEKMFNDPYFYTVLRNTLVISISKLLLVFPIPIIFALLLNELRCMRYKKVVQTVSYLPNFISWVILSGIFISLFSLDGPVNAIISALGFEPKVFFADSVWFFVMLLLTEAYKSFGWGSIIYMAALSSIDAQQYEAADIDGATRFQKIKYITLPGLIPVITINLVFTASGILSAGFDQIFNMYNPSVYEIADIIDTWVYRLGIIDRDFSFSTAVGLFKSVVAIVLVLLANKLGAIINKEKYTMW